MNKETIKKILDKHRPKEGKFYIIIEPGLTCLNKEQVVHEDDLEKHKKEFDWKEDYQTFSFKEFLDSPESE